MSFRLKRIFITLIICAATSLVSAHPIHVSVINMDITPDGKIEFSVKLFVDDFQTVLNRHNKTDFILNSLTNTRQIKPFVINYIYSKFNIDLDTSLNKKQYQLNKIDINEESIWLYFEIDAKVGKALKITNTLVCELFDDQSNLMIVSRAGNDLAYRFTNKDISFVFEF
jgi:hypothetical protein